MLSRSSPKRPRDLMTAHTKTTLNNDSVISREPSPVIPPDVLEILACPACRGSLQTAGEGPHGLSCARCERDYPIVEGIPVLLPWTMDEVSTLVKGFYDTQWQRDTSGTLKAKVQHEDLSTLGQRYIHANESRFKGAAGQGAEPGRFFLDAACGAQPRTDFGSAYGDHVCVDLSLDGLIVARSVLGDRAVPICGSLLQLPLRDGSVDGMIASHCIYHIDRHYQPQALAELARVLKRDGSGVIFYTNPKSPEEYLAACLKRLIRPFRRRGGEAGDSSGGPRLYYYAHPIGTIQRVLDEHFGAGRVTARLLRLLDRRISRCLFAIPLLGIAACLTLLRLERACSRFPRLGSYVAYVVERQTSGRHDAAE